MELVHVERATPRPDERATPGAVVEGQVAREDTPSRALVVASREERHPVLSALAGLPAAAWRRPVVRAAVRTGASAVALSVATRLATRWVRSRAARGAALDAGLRATSGVPMLGSLLEQTPRLPQRQRGRHTTVITEAFIYARRIERN